MEINKKTYIKEENNFYKGMRKYFGRRIALYCVTGSLSYDQIILGWSDIDVLIVIKGKYNKTMFSYIEDLRRKSKIKIGITMYTQEEFLSETYKDPKTHRSVFMLHKGIYVPRIISTLLKVELVDIFDMETVEMAEASMIVHDIKRELLNLPDYNEKKILKGIYTIMKIICQRKGHFPIGYEETARCYKRLFPNYSFIITPQTIMQNKLAPGLRTAKYFEFLNNIINNKYAQFHRSKK